MSAGKKIDINSASETDIATLPGIGPVTAKAIVDGRPWDELSALTAKKVMPQPVFERNKDRFALANINTSSAADIAKTLPGIGDKTAPKIVNGRPYATPQDLVTKKILTAGQFAKIKDVITY
jgi:competence protein ComEA